MKITIAFLSIFIPSFASMVLAENCTPRLTYCECNVFQKVHKPFSLHITAITSLHLNKGVYLSANGIGFVPVGEEPTENAINNALHLCWSGTNEAIYFMRHCKNDSVYLDGAPGKKIRHSEKMKLLAAWKRVGANSGEWRVESMRWETVCCTYMRTLVENPLSFEML